MFASCRAVGQQINPASRETQQYVRDEWARASFEDVCMCEDISEATVALAKRRRMALDSGVAQTAVRTDADARGVTDVVPAAAAAEQPGPTLAAAVSVDSIFHMPRAQGAQISEIPHGESFGDGQRGPWPLNLVKDFYEGRLFRGLRETRRDHACQKRGRHRWIMATGRLRSLRKLSARLYVALFARALTLRRM